MLKKSEREIIKTALIEYRTQCFRNFRGTEKEKRLLGKLNKLIVTWETGPDPKDAVKNPIDAAIIQGTSAAERVPQPE